jgi:hypothetical protein
VLDTFFVKKDGTLDEALEPIATMFSSFHNISTELFSRLLSFPLQCPKYSSQFSTEDSEELEDQTDQADVTGSIRTLLQATVLLSFNKFVTFLRNLVAIGIL